MWLAIEDRLKTYPNTSQKALADFLLKEYKVRISRATTRKVMTTIAKERNQDLRDDYIDRRAHFNPKQMIFVNESGDDRGLAILRLGYAPKGVYKGHIDIYVFEAFLKRLLPYCGRFPEPRSIVFMDNASFYNISIKIKEKFAKAGYFFGSLKNHIRSRSLEDEDLIHGDFKSYIQMQIKLLGQGEMGKKMAKAHFKKAQIYIQ
ncbi:hypothetical protein ACQKWADRAFT_297565 [Trichoderma austrokoningii]